MQSTQTPPMHHGTQNHYHLVTLQIEERKETKKVTPTEPEHLNFKETSIVCFIRTFKVKSSPPKENILKKFWKPIERDAQDPSTRRKMKPLPQKPSHFRRFAPTIFNLNPVPLFWDFQRDCSQKTPLQNNQDAEQEHLLLRQVLRRQV